MSLSAREQRALDSIDDSLTGSAPHLASLLATFTQLTSGEDMPARERIRAGRWLATHGPRFNQRHPRLNTLRWHTRRTGQRLGWHRAMLLLWLAVAIVLTSIAMVVSRGSGKGACTVPLVVVACAGPAPAHAGRLAK